MWKRQWLFHAMDFQSLMYPCFTICRICGIFPYKMNASTFEFSKLYYIVSIMAVCVCCVLKLILIYNIVISISTQNFEEIITGISNINYLVLSCFIIIITQVLSGPQMRLLQTVSEISQKLSSKSYQKMSKLIHAKDIFGTILFFLQEFIFLYNRKTFKLNNFTILIKVSSLYLHILIFEILMLYVNCVCVLKACFKSINDNLTHMQRLVVNDIKLCVPGLICHIQRNQILLKLKILKKWHLRVSDTVQMLNTIFGLQLLATIVTFFINITFDIYFDVMHWQDGVFINFDMHFLHMFYSPIAYYVIKMMLLVWACETGKNQAQEIKTTVHDLLNNIKDEQIKNELQLFSLQILHCKNTFSMKGLTIDATLLTAVSNQLFVIIPEYIMYIFFRKNKDAKMKKWQLFHAMDFLSLMHPCFNFCRILGIFPYKINILTFEASKPYYIMSTVITCVCCVLNLALIHHIFISKIINFENVIENLESLAFYVISGFVVSTTHVLSGPRMRLLQTILDISLKLPSESYQKLSRLIHVKDIFGNILLIVKLSIFFYKILELTYSNVLEAILIMYLELIMFQMNMLYVNCVCVLKSYFKRINDNLVYMQKLVIKDINRVPGLLCHTQGNQFLIKLKILQKQHLIVSEILQMMNTIFSPQIFAIVVMSLIETTIELYFYVVDWKDGVFINLNWQFFDILLTSMVFYIMKITLLVWACETGKNQAQKLNTTVHDILNSTSDEPIKYELQLFSLQILHHKNIFSTKAFTMDASLLTAVNNQLFVLINKMYIIHTFYYYFQMMSSITTYMLIIIQFVIMSHSCDEKSVTYIT
ncbi:GR28B protein, partial [Acromyrmex insinuator]